MPRNHYLNINKFGFLFYFSIDVQLIFNFMTFLILPNSLFYDKTKHPSYLWIQDGVIGTTMELLV